MVDASAMYGPRGSSPRGRGKPTHAIRVSLNSRLIPAWAGKTGILSVASCGKPAHPRVGGENRALREGLLRLGGSSPRGRGKRPGLGLLLRRPGLIPAWAGKTQSSTSPADSKAAHPRVGGENAAAEGVYGAHGGSSPRGRGKPRW